MQPSQCLEHSTIKHAFTGAELIVQKGGVDKVIIIHLKKMEWSPTSTPESVSYIYLNSQDASVWGIFRPTAAPTLDSTWQAKNSFSLEHS